LVAQFQYNKSDDTYTCPQGEILKPREDGTRKAVELSKAVISSRNTHPCKKCPVNHLCTSRTAGRELTEANMPMPWKKQQTLSGKSAIIPHAAENEHIFGTIKDNGVTITLI
jgi:hypothetical protein